MSVLVTGANGYIGKALCDRLNACGVTVLGVTRGPCPASFGFPCLSAGDFTDSIDWSELLCSSAGVSYDCIVHCAARSHVMAETTVGSLAAYRAVNVLATRRLAEQAAKSGVRRFIYLSSIKVNGERTGLTKPFSNFDVPAPEDPYGISKSEAECVLRDISAREGMEVVIIRPPLVYGPAVKGNLARLLKLTRLGLPLPFGAVYNQRSFIGLDNLVDILIRCVDHPAAQGQTLLVSDGENVSTPDLLRYMAAALGRSARLLPVPVTLLCLAARLMGKRAEINRLVGSLIIDDSHTREVLDWTPPVSLAEGIFRMVQGE